MTATHKQSAARKAFAKALRNWRRRHHLTQDEAALKLSTAISTFQAWEQGRNMPVGLAWEVVNRIINEQ